MSGKPDDVKKGYPVSVGTEQGVRAVVVVKKSVKADGAKGGRKMNTGRTERWK
jgi:hypothetical protein